MSVIPELILQTTIFRGIKTMKEDSRYIDQLFRSLNQEDLSQIREFLRSNTIGVELNYPRETPKMPAIIILLRNEDEANEGAFLNDSMGMEVPDVFGYETGIMPDVLTGAGSVSTTSGLGPVLFGPHKASSGTVNTLTIPTTLFKKDYAIQNCEVRIVGGTGVGQQRTIIENSRTTLTVNKNWKTIPNNTTIFEIRLPVTEVLGEPAKLYNRRQPNLHIERKGSLYQLRYQIQIIGANPEQTIYLYTIIKAILTISRTFLEGHGVINMKLGGTDFAPKSEYLPDLAYMRALNMTFLYPFDTFVENTEIAHSFILKLQDGLAVLLSSTEGDIGDPDPEVTE